MDSDEEQRTSLDAVALNYQPDEEFKFNDNDKLQRSKSGDLISKRIAEHDGPAYRSIAELAVLKLVHDR